MAGNNDWAKNFQARCQDVGWSVEATSSNHCKVRDARGKLLLTISTTPGDKRAMMNALSQAKRAGLEQLEQQVKLRRERDRLARIEADRQRGGYTPESAAETAFETASETASETTAGTATKTATDSPIESTRREESEVKIENHYAEGRDLVRGYKVLIRQKAHLVTKNFKTDEMQSHMYPDIDELQLENGDVVYQCASRRNAGCCFTAAVPESVRAHLRSHSPATKVNQLVAELEEVKRREAEAKTELEERIKRKSEGSKRAAQTRRERAAAPAQANGHAPVTDVSSASQVRETPSLDAVRALAERVALVSAEVDGLIGGLRNITLELSSVQHELAKLPVADPETLEKAAALDAIRTQLRLT